MVFITNVKKKKLNLVITIFRYNTPNITNQEYLKTLKKIGMQVKSILLHIITNIGVRTGYSGYAAAWSTGGPKGP